MTEAAVEARAARKEYGAGEKKVRALNDVSLVINKGEFFTLLGPSGCGKTTLLRLIAGFESPTSGMILLGARDISTMAPYDRPVNTVFQSYALFPHLSVADNIGFGLTMQGTPKAQVQARVAEMLALVKLEAFAERKPQQLSGGQQQRVALARALAPAPEVLLLDEPLSALDLKLRKEMQLELKRLQTETGITFVFVTHDQEEALTMSDRIGVMRDGSILQIGGPREIYNKPVNRFVADFIGETNVLTGTVEQGGVRLPTGDVIAVDNIDAASQGAEVSLAVRPEQVRIGDGTLQGRVAETVYFGTDTHCHLRMSDDTEVVARMQSPPSGDTGLQEGQTVAFDFVPGAVRVLED
ncbi:ABC transporter ATP-binding protein [Roseovarius atlanticus]|uniref:ABC transporter ATP-binding protein n=1 Tax=Roseovarius atlanticus TaxID=1641875 RepID=UPI001C972DA5|nr:ABC transporter ATP-binding protein [Roseovarius atlanticus]MBY5990254.1 ABC transporter ATP-binding protein [Roseovarius atlanticus]MBY6126800.1 ABC transporter ATP-binding protein [Roseovarius atlanticus]MBY6151293.1 ABC transporter ATP-binding protein [Roseovarius atlanticus]